MTSTVTPNKTKHYSARPQKQLPPKSMTENGSKKTELPEDVRTQASESEWFAIIPARVLSDARLSLAAKVVYGAIASFSANWANDVWASHEQIAERARMSPRSVGRPIAELTSAGHLAVHRRGRTLTNIYSSVTTLPSDITQECNHSAALSEDAGEGTLSMKRKMKRNSTQSQDEPETLFSFYAQNVRLGPKLKTISSIKKLLTQYSYEELMGTVKAYMQTHEAQGEMQFRYKPNNFFGNKEYFTEYLPAEPDSKCDAIPPKELTPEEDKIRQRLRDAGQA